MDPEETRANMRVRQGLLQEARSLRDSALGEDYARVCEFYKGRHVFITGASGFIGKVVVEKLLRTCPDIGNIYVLIRPRRGQEPEARLKAMLEVAVGFDVLPTRLPPYEYRGSWMDPQTPSSGSEANIFFPTQLFDRLRAENPSAMDKVVAIRGDCMLDGMGISAADRRTLVDRVSVIIHSAASVRFTDPIKNAVKMNLRSTVDIVELAREMKNLAVRDGRGPRAQCLQRV